MDTSNLIESLKTLTLEALSGMEKGIVERSGPLLSGGPERITQETRDLLGDILPKEGKDDSSVVNNLSYILARGAADPHNPYTIAHLHCPPHTASIAADIAVNTLNPSLDSWDQAPSAIVIEQALCQTINQVVYPQSAQADTIITSGGSESNLIALLISREKLGKNLQIITGENSHHSIYRSCWQLGLNPPIKLPTPQGIINPHVLEEVLQAQTVPTLIVATAGTTDEGLIDPLADIAKIAEKYQARLHIDAAYGGMLLFTEEFRSQLTGIDLADSVTLDFHKLSFQPVAASALAVLDKIDFQPLTVQADYLNASDDSAAGIPDVLDRSIKTTRRLDALKVIASWQSLGRQGISTKIGQCIQHAHRLATLLDASGRYERPREEIGISTVLFRPRSSTPESTARIRRELLFQGKAVLGRATLSDGSIWLKTTFLNSDITEENLQELLRRIDSIHFS